MFNSVLSIVSLFTFKAEAQEAPAPAKETRHDYGVRLAVLCTDLHEALAAGRMSEVEYLRKEIDKLMGK
ncbi:hypothetical protein pEaSNUABM11_00127 [Erwinia phage pEa_SNUABM_11]|nr:hypothetical protein pEaSNUABM11_00127 [Erwinia phage pEa_SNUABM_11]